MEESLVNLVGNTIKELAPAAQVLCKKQLILWKLGRMGIFRVVDLQTMVDSDIQMVVAALSPTPQLFAFKLKQAVTALLAGAAERQSTSSQFSPAGAASTAGAVSTAGAASTAGATSPANATSPAGTTPGSGAFQTPPAKCLACKSAEGELRACSFCKSGIYHDNANCLGEQRASEASLTYKSFPWCCPKCFQRGKVALEKILLGPSQTNKRRR